MAKPVNKITTPDLAKKRGHYNDGEYHQQEADKDQKGVNSEQYLYEPRYILHIKGECNENMLFTKQVRS